MAETFVVPVKGIGKPDYTREVSAGRERPGLYLKANQQLALWGYLPTDLVVHVPLPYPIPWVKPVLAAGATAHLIDMATGIPLPFYLPVGFGATLIESTWHYNQDIELAIYFGNPGPPNLLVTCSGGAAGLPQHFSHIYSYSTLSLDPLALLPHFIDCVVINRGGADLRGGMEVVVIIEAIGTPPFPTEKATRCPFCQADNKVPVITTVIKCAKCGNTYYVWVPISGS